MFTCSEFNNVNIHANATALSLMANSPNTHVTPRRGTTIIAALINDLFKGTEKQKCILLVIIF